MFLLLIPLAFAVVYLVLAWLFQAFFAADYSFPTSWSWSSLFLIIVVSYATLIISGQIPGIEWGNRIQHALAGGFASFFVCFLVVRDGNFSISRFQFFIFSFLIVMTLGIGNEVLEFIGQHYYDLTFATEIGDTWLDLISNAVGALVGAAVFVPFVRSTDS